MNDDNAPPSGSKHLSLCAEPDEPHESADDIQQLRTELSRYREALEDIRDRTFEQGNSPRLIDQLWHFVRWSKATARDALEQPGEKNDK